MTSPYEIKKEICEIGRRIYMNGFVAANDGNISVKVSDNEFYCTPTGVSKGFMTPDMIIKIDAEGNKLEGKLNPSSEIKMHMRCYKERPDIRSVVHAHPPTATGFAIAGIPLDKYTMPEAVISLGEIPLTAYGTPSTMEIPDAVSKELQNHDAFLLQNHGALTVGISLLNAYFKMETLEFFAKISLVARQLGNENEFTCDQIEKLLEVRRNMKIPGRHPGCSKCSRRGTSSCKCLVPGSEPAPAPAPTQAPAPADSAMVEEITRKILAALQK